MSLFNDLVVKIERRTLQERTGSVPLRQISDEWEFRAKVTTAACIGFCALAQIAICFHYIPYGSGFEFGAPDWRWSLSIVVCVFVFWCLKISDYVDSAARERIRMHDKKARLAREEQERKDKERAGLEYVANLNRQRIAEADALAYEEATAYRRELLAMRQALLSNMENQIRDALIDGRRRKLALEWAPDFSETGVHEMIRHNIRRSGIPEFGILHRSTDHTVLEVLGDRSCLPPEPSEQVLGRRHLPHVKQLLISIS